MTKTTREEQAEQTRQRILETALRLFVERGFSGTSTRRIAKEAGVSEGLIFHHFPRKRDLLADLRKQRGGLSTRIIARMGAPDVSVTQIAEELAAGITELLCSRTQEARLFQVLIGESRHDPELRDIIADTNERLSEAMTVFLRERIAAGEVREDLGCEAAATSLIGAIFWFYATSRDPDDPAWPARARAHLDKVIDLWLRGTLA